MTLGKTKIDSDLFDSTAGYEDETGIRFASGLSDEERKQATMLYRLFNELWGVCIIVGDPGTGKDLFGNYLAYKIKRYFPWKRILRDEKPRELFGEYAGLFNESVLAEDLAKMRAMCKGVKTTDLNGVMEKAADDWATNEGTVLLKNSLLYLAEYWRYCYNREPHNPMNKTMGGVQKMKRHLDCLVVGTSQLTSDLDRKTSKPWIDWQVTCTRSAINKTGFTFFIHKVRYDKRMDSLETVGTPFPISIDAGRPRAELGDGKIVVRKANYRPETEEERIVLTVLNAGVDTYEKLVDLLDDKGDMAEYEVLDTLKELKFSKHKRVIDYPCYFGLYNSKSAPQLETRLRIEE